MALNLLHQVSMDSLYFLTHGDLLHKFVNMSQTVITSAESIHEENSLSSVNEDQKNLNPPGQDCSINQSPNFSHVGNRT